MKRQKDLPLEFDAVVGGGRLGVSFGIRNRDLLVGDVVGNNRSRKRLKARGGVYVIADVARVEQEVTVGINGRSSLGRNFAVSITRCKRSSKREFSRESETKFCSLDNFNPAVQCGKHPNGCN